jgi:hypothetical protein
MIKMEQESWARGEAKTMVYPESLPGALISVGVVEKVVFAKSMILV